MLMVVVCGNKNELIVSKVSGIVFEKKKIEYLDKIYEVIVLIDKIVIMGSVELMEDVKLFDVYL